MVSKVGYSPHDLSYRMAEEDWPTDEAFWLGDGNRLPEKELRTDLEARNEACIPNDQKVSAFNENEEKRKESYEAEQIGLQEQEDEVDYDEEKEFACSSPEPEMELAACEIPKIPEIKYEYLDHTADVQLHAWGSDLKEAFEQVAMAMFAYMTTDISKVEVKSRHEVHAKGDDLQSLLYHFLDELLFLFSVEPYIICRVVKILKFDEDKFTIHAEGYGETFDLKKHPPGTEVKAITYSNMQIHSKKETHDIFVIIDI